MITKIQTFLSELKTSLSLCENENVNTEAHDNMFALDFTETDTKALTSKDIELFLVQCRDIYVSNNSAGPKFYYCWLDEMAGQLRMSAISQAHSKLPFRANLKSCSLSEFAQVIAEYDSGIYTRDCLSVWQIGI